jgi:hypothetical protein
LAVAARDVAVQQARATNELMAAELAKINVIADALREDEILNEVRKITDALLDNVQETADALREEVREALAAAGTVKTVNGVSPDENGNVQITRAVTQFEYDALEAAGDLVPGVTYIIIKDDGTDYGVGDIWSFGSSTLFSAPVSGTYIIKLYGGGGGSGGLKAGGNGGTTSFAVESTGETGSAEGGKGQSGNSTSGAAGGNGLTQNGNPGGSGGSGRQGAGGAGIDGYGRGGNGGGGNYVGNGGGGGGGYSLYSVFLAGCEQVSVTVGGGGHFGNGGGNFGNGNSGDNGRAIISLYSIG